MKNIFFLLVATPFFAFAQHYQEGEVLDFFLNGNANADSLHIDTISLYKRKITYGSGSNKIMYNLINLNGKWVEDSISAPYYNYFPSYVSGKLKKLRLSYKYPDFICEEFYDIKNKKADGDFFAYQGNILIQKGHYTKGIKNGYWTSFYSNGVIKETGHYTKGIKDGKWQTNYVNGSVESKGDYIRKNITVFVTQERGMFAVYNNKDTILTYTYSQYEQDLILYHYKGAYNNSFPFCMHLKNGVWSYFDENGKISKKEFFEKGVFKKEE